MRGFRITRQADSEAFVRQPWDEAFLVLLRLSLRRSDPFQDGVKCSSAYAEHFGCAVFIAA